MAAANLALRFALEVAGIVAAAYWGYHAVESPLPRIVLAVAAPAVLIVIWTFVVAPGAQNPIPALPRVLIGSVLLLLVAAGAALVGARLQGTAYAGLVVLNTALMVALGS